VSAVTGGAGTIGAVEVQTADAGIGPSSFVEDGLAIGVLEDASEGFEVGGLAFVVGLEVIDIDGLAIGGFEGDLAAVTLGTTGLGAGHTVDHVNIFSGSGGMRIEGDARAFDGFGEEVIERGEDEASLGVMALFEFLGFLGMTAGTVHGSDDGGDVGTIVIEAVNVSLNGLVAFDATDALDGVGASLPVVDDAGGRFAVTFDTGFGGGGYGDVMRDLSDFFAFAENFEILNQNQGCQEEDAQESDHVLFESEVHAGHYTGRRVLKTDVLLIVF